MGKKVTNLKVTKQTGTDNTYFATWEFAEPKVYTKSKYVLVGSVVSFDYLESEIVQFTNGVKVSSDVKNDTWKVADIKGNNARLGKNKSGTKNLNSTVSMKHLKNADNGKKALIPIANTDHYSVHWYYSSGDGVWFDGGASDVKVKNATYTPPSNAIRMKCVVKPVSKTYKENVKSGKTTKQVTKSYWTGDAVSVIRSVEGVNNPETLGAPTVSIDQYKLTASIDNITDSKCDKVSFYILKDKKKAKIVTAEVKASKASITITVDAGCSYDVRCRAINVVSSKTSITGEWGEWTYDTKSAPGKIKKITSVKALTETSAYISWDKVAQAEKYEIEYTEKKEYFDSSNAVSSTSVDANVNHAEITGLTTGTRYYFRVRVTNSAGSSNWTTGTYTVALGTKPSAPTTWSNKTVLGIGEKILLYWVQNSEDGSDQSHAQLNLSIDGVSQPTINLDKYIGKDDTNSVYTIDTKNYTKDTVIKWSIRTAGVAGEYGDWSITREVKVYAQPTVQLTLSNKNNEPITEITSFPIVLECTTQPDTQKLISASVTISSNDTYQTMDNLGNFKMVYAGDVIFNKYCSGTPQTSKDGVEYDDNRTAITLSANNIDFESGHTYTINCVVALDSGLTATDTIEMTVEWEENKLSPDASIVIDPETLTAIISPWCVDENEELAVDVLLSVYRREFDGTFTEIETGVANTMGISVPDQHPALDTASYRIIAIDQNTGVVSYADVAEDVGETAVIIQWDEQWGSYDASGGDGDALEEPAWTCKMLRLPYNIDISDSFNPDTELLEYAGREHPVSYYGTQIGHTSNWNVVIPHNDKDTLSMIRELIRWLNDVYVREPSGTGYWASISVSYSQTHCELTTPVQFSVTRVEGGK